MPIYHDLQPGDHLCWLYETAEEHKAIVAPFLQEGLERNERVVYATDTTPPATILGYLQERGLDGEAYLGSDQLRIVPADQLYLPEGAFDPERTIGRLRAETDQALATGYAALRFMGEMSWAGRGLPGSQRLIEYEARLNDFFAGHRCLAICQYDRRRFAPQLLLDVLTTHPRAIVGTEIYDNFYYIPPQEFLGQDLPAARLAHRLDNLAEHKQTKAALQQAHDELEQRVQARTEDLTRLNAQLQHEIAERIEIEAALRASERRHRLLAENATDMISRHTPEGVYLYASPACQTLLGYEPDDLVGHDAYEFFHPDDLEAIDRSHTTILDEPTVFTVHYRLRRKDGTYVWAETTSKAIRDPESGQVQGIIAVTRDTSERKRAEDALQASEAKYRQLFSEMMSGFALHEIVCDEAGTPVDYVTLEVNRAYEQLLGIRRGDVVGKRALEVVPDLDREWIDIFGQVALTGEPHHYVQHASNLGRWFEGSAYSPQAGQVAVTFVDVTDQRLAREQIEAALGEAQWREEELSALLETAKLIPTCGSFEEAARAIFDNSTQLIGARSGYVALLAEDGQENELLFLDAGGLPCDVDPELPMPIRGLRAEAYRQGRPVYDNDFAHSAWLDYMPPGHVQLDNVLFAPVNVQGRAVGLIGMANKPAGFTTRDARVAGAFGDLAAIALRYAQLQERLGSWASVFEHAAWGIATCDAASLMLDMMNPAFARMHGYSAAELTGTPLMNLLAPGSRQAGADQLRQARQAGHHTFEWEHVHRNGATFPVLVNVTVVQAGLGRVRHYVLNVHNISERKRAEAILQRSLEETARGERLLLALSKAAQAVQRARTGQEVYRTVGAEVTRLGYEAAILILDDEGRRLDLTYLTIGAGRLATACRLLGISGTDYGFPLAPGGLFASILADGQAVYAERTIDYVAEALPTPARPLARQVVELLDLGHSILTPLRTGDQVIGLLVVTGQGLTKLDIPAMTAFANQASIAIENARLYEAQDASRRQLRDLADYLQTVREDERTHIAREIHDELGQALTALKIDLSWLTKRLGEDEVDLAHKATDMSELIDQVIQMVRRIATELRPGLLDDLGLVAALEWQAQDFSQRTGIASVLDLGSDDLVLDRDLATTIFRIYQEALTNVARHAEASQVHVALEDKPDELILLIQDNGRGLACDEVTAPHSLGLMGMRERARAWDGDVFFESPDGQGTRVRVCIPRR